MLELACIVEKGTREYNDDRASVNGVYIEDGACSTQSPEDICLAIVCDGAGGYAHGHKAAEICTEVMSQLYGECITVECIEKQIVKANDAVIAAQRTDRKYAEMKTTVAGLYINGDDFIAFNIGDSRIYRIRAYLSQISTDHSLWQQQLDLGLIPKPGMESVLTRCIGGDDATPAVVQGIDRVFEGDIYIICTDGIWGVLEPDDFENLLSQGVGATESAEIILNLAMEKGSQDNLSIIIIRRTS